MPGDPVPGRPRAQTIELNRPAVGKDELSFAGRPPRLIRSVSSRGTRPGPASSSEKRDFRRTLTATQVGSRTAVEAFGLPGRLFFSSHPWFLGPFPVSRPFTGSPRGPSMRDPSRPTRIRRMLKSRLQQLVPAGPVLAASLNRVSQRCGQPSCSCHKGGPFHQAHHLAVRQGGKCDTPLGLKPGGFSEWPPSYRPCGLACVRASTVR
jgi:hypothetical protein